MKDRIRIAINLLKLKNMASGLGQFSYQFGTHIHDKCHKYADFGFMAPKGFFYKFGQNNKYTTCPIVPTLFKNWSRKYALYHAIHQDTDLIPSRKAKFIYTIHDMNFLFEKPNHKVWKYLKRMQRMANQATIITAISDFTKCVIMDNLDLKGKEVQVIKNGVELNTWPHSQRPNFIPTSPYLFTIGMVLPKKNFHVLIPMMKGLPNYKLIIAGDCKNPYAKETMKMVEKNGLTSQITFLGTISEYEKYWYYKCCEAFVYPSLYEGFGIPIIEAMRMGKPVFTSKSTSLPEIGGDKAYYWDYFEPIHMANKIIDGMGHYHSNVGTIKDSLIQHSNKYLWDTSIMQYIHLYEEVLGEKIIGQHHSDLMAPLHNKKEVEPLLTK